MKSHERINERLRDEIGTFLIPNRCSSVAPGRHLVRPDVTITSGGIAPGQRQLRGI
jgi:hypothetical protein